MEKYIAKINNKVLKKYDEEGQRKVKRKYLIGGGVTLGLGLAGFISAFLSFIILLLNYKTDQSMIAWIVAVPFILVFIVGSVLTRIGDKLLTEGYNEEVEKKKKGE